MQKPSPASALLQASDLPAAWADQSGWTILDTSFGGGERFMATWMAWRTDTQRPTMLHYVGHITPEAYRHHFSPPFLDTSEDYQALCKAVVDRTNGVHRLLLDKGQVSLTLCIGNSKTFFAGHTLFANTLWVDARHFEWDKWTSKALARLCTRGANLIARLPDGPNSAWLREAGFVQITDASGLDALRATFDPAWTLGTKEPPVWGKKSITPKHCCVVGAGVSGASVAYAMARRGWRVTVIDKAMHSAAGASGLPAGLVVPHTSVDDSPRSRLSRVGARLMLQHANELLEHGKDWAMSGVYEHRFGDGLDRHHTHAGWVKPRALVHAWLAHTGVTVCFGADVQRLAHHDAKWSLFDAKNAKLLSADVIVMANAYGAKSLLNAQDLSPYRAMTLPLTLQDLQAVHGTASIGVVASEETCSWGATPHNGHGCFILTPEGMGKSFWLAGSSFEPDAAPTAQSMRDHRLAPLREQHQGNLARLTMLIPSVAGALSTQFGSDGVRSWSGTRCVTHDRLPLAGPVDARGRSGLWMHVGMGARGLTFSALGAELVAARICSEPWPIEANLARSIDSQRLRKRRAVRAEESDQT